ncbi:hypothetical protein [Escherichia phage vB_EcoP_PHB20]|uniref:Uncharacterized protein n=2 Tax=Teseptimavirus IME390 TaxID=2733870 RepID=A0A386KES7_9CAUD|nr:DUF5516 domain-containing protein [Enterobacteria phage vB_EcoP_IME390]AYD82941.1 hypothetical protein [Enterobacteria phage vB_EcoP_IME390]QHI00807.1 hypothetical protein [Escherichia phage vB_EcoP_PHB20]
MEAVAYIGIGLCVLGMCLIAWGLWDLARIIKALQDSK